MQWIHFVFCARILPSPPNDSILLSQQLQPGFVAPKTPTPLARATTQKSASKSDPDSDDDIFASASCTTICDQEIQSGICALLNGPGDVSWTSSMATPQTGNVTCTDLNTEERKVLLPSDDCGLAVSLCTADSKYIP